LIVTDEASSPPVEDEETVLVGQVGSPIEDEETVLVGEVGSPVADRKTVEVVVSAAIN